MMNKDNEVVVRGIPRGYRIAGSGPKEDEFDPSRFPVRPSPDEALESARQFQADTREELGVFDPNAQEVEPEAVAAPAEAPVAEILESMTPELDAEINRRMDRMSKPPEGIVSDITGGMGLGKTPLQKIEQEIVESNKKLAVTSADIGKASDELTGLYGELETRKKSLDARGEVGDAEYNQITEAYTRGVDELKNQVDAYNGLIGESRDQLLKQAEAIEPMTEELKSARAAIQPGDQEAINAYREMEQNVNNAIEKYNTQIVPHTELIASAKKHTDELGKNVAKMHEALVGKQKTLNESNAQEVAEYEKLRDKYQKVRTGYMEQRETHKSLVEGHNELVEKAEKFIYALPATEGETLGQGPGAAKTDITAAEARKKYRVSVGAGMGMMGAAFPEASIPYREQTQEQKVAKAQNVMALKKEFGERYSAEEIAKAQEVLKKPEGDDKPYSKQEIYKAEVLLESAQLTGMPYSEISKNYDNIIKQTGLNKYPEAMNFLPGLVLMPLSAGVLNPLSVAGGFAAFEVASELVNGAVSFINDDPYKFHAGKGLEDLLPEEADEQTKKVVELIDLIMKGAIVHGAYKSTPGAFEKLTKDVFKGAGIPKKVGITREMLRAAHGGTDKISPENLNLYARLNGKMSKAEILRAAKEGLTIEVEADTMIGMVDKPYWAKVKSLFGIKPYSDIHTMKGKPLSYEFGAEGKAKATGAAPPAPAKPGGPQKLIGGEPTGDYHIYDKAKKAHVPAINAEKIDVPWLPKADFFVHKDGDVFVISEGTSGANIDIGEFETAEQAQKALIDMIETEPERAQRTIRLFDNMLKKSVGEHGLSPRYAPKVEKVPEAEVKKPEVAPTAKKVEKVQGKPSEKATVPIEVKPGDKVVWTPRAEDVEKKGALPVEGQIAEVVKSSTGGIGWKIMKEDGDVLRVWADRGTLTSKEKAPVEPAKAPVEPTKEVLPGPRNFRDSVTEQFGFSEAEAGKIWDAYKKAKVVKPDINDGYKLKDGRFWDKEVMQRALAGEAPEPKEAPVPRVYEDKPPAVTGAKGVAKTESGIKVDYNYGVFDVNDIVTSHDTGLKLNPEYPQELQPRDRTKMASEIQVGKIEKELMPERLGENPMVSEGAPIVNKSAIVESGNARVIALKRLYEAKAENAKKYKQYLMDNAEKFGLDPAAVKKMDNPVMVRQRTGEIKDIDKYIAEANVAAVAQMSATEQAMSDANILSDNIMNMFVPAESGEINTAGNREFIQRFFSTVVSPTEMGRYMTDDGRLSQDGLTRIRNAIYAKTYGDAKTIERLSESTDNNIKNISNTLLTVAPKFAIMDNAIKAGTRQKLSLTAHMAQAAEKLSFLRDQGTPVQEFLDQTAMFDDGMSNLAKDLLSIYNTFGKSAKKLTRLFDRYSELVDMLGDPNQKDMFGETTQKATPAEVLQQALNTMEGDYVPLDIFEAESARSEEIGKLGKKAPRKEGSQEKKNLAFNPEQLKYPKKEEFVEETDKIVKRSEIAGNISKMLNVPIRQGKYRGKALGIFKPHGEIIRIKRGNIVTISHELGHYIDVAIPDELSQKINDREMGELLKEYAVKPSTPKHKEALGEFLRFYITDPSRAKRVAPRFSEYFEKVMSKYPEVSGAIITARRDYQRWLNMPAASKVLSQISMKQKTTGLGKKISGALGDIYTTVFDDLYPLKTFSDLAKEEGTAVEAEDDPYVLARVMKGWVSKANVFLEKGTFNKKFWKVEDGKTVPVFKDKSLRRILAPVEKSGAMEDLTIYLTSKRVMELNKRGIETGIHTKDASDAAQEIERKHPEFKKTASDIYKFQDDVLVYGLQSGLYDRETYIKLKKLNKNYVPFYRVMEEMQAGGYFGKRLADVSKQIRKIKGSEREIINPLESIVKNTYAIIYAADRNQVGVMMANLAAKNKENARLFEEIPAPMAKVAKVELKEFGLGVQDAMDDAGINEDEAIDIFRPAMFAPKDNVLTVLMDGKKRYFQVDPDIYKAMMASDTETVGVLMKVLSIPTKLLRAGAILAPEFAVRNPIRDVMTAYVYSEYGFVPIVDNIKAIFSLAKKDNDYQLWKMGGGDHSMMVSMDRKYLQKSFDEIVKGKGFKDYLKSPLDALRIVSEISEKLNRLPEAKRALSRGESPVRAALASRDITLDFAKGGGTSRALNSIIAFWKANVLDWEKFIVKHKNNPARTTFKAVAGITVPSIILYLINRDDDRWKEIPQWQKDLFWIIMTDKHIYRIPKPFTLGMLYGSIPERILEYIDNKDPRALDELMDSLIRGASPGVIPTALLPIIENETNYSMFSERPIVPEARKDMPPEAQYGGHTSEIAKTLGEIFDYSPAKIDNLFSGYFGGLGKYATGAMDEILKGTGISPKITEPTLTMADRPVVKAFVVRRPIGSASASVNRFYEELKEITGHEKLLKEYLRENEKDAFYKYVQKHPNIYLRFDWKTKKYYSIKARYLRKSAALLSELRGFERDVYNSKTMSREEKREKIDKIDTKITEIAQKSLNYEKILKDEDK